MLGLLEVSLISKAWEHYGLIRLSEKFFDYHDFVLLELFLFLLCLIDELLNLVYLILINYCYSFRCDIQAVALVW